MFLLVVSFAFCAALSAQISQIKADKMVFEHMSKEMQFFEVYAKDSVQTEMTLSTTVGETVALDYDCWAYFISYTNTGRYLIVNKSNGQLLEMKSKDMAIPENLEDWRLVNNLYIEIASNLYKNGSIDSALIVGDWVADKMAYTADGIEIEDYETVFSEHDIKFYPYAFIDDKLFNVYFIHTTFCYSRSENLINFSFGEKFLEYIPYKNDDIRIGQAILNAYSFVLIDDKLIFQFTGEENKNLLILKRKAS